MVESSEAKTLGFDVPMIERLTELSVPFTMLQEQYRMDPLISSFPNAMFYDSQIKDHFAQRRYNGFVFPAPVNSIAFFYDIPSCEEISGNGASMVNRYEAETIAKIINMLEKQKIPAEEIGVITFYDGQRGFILQYLQKTCSVDYAEKVEVMSVDGSQGREKGFIILSCVRANKKLGVGFLEEFRRLNVAMTRAKFGLAVCGNLATLIESPLWNSLIDFFSSKNLIFKGEVGSLVKESVKVPTLIKMTMKRRTKYQDN
jgi:regulator of nonsense transcripts 1